ncbi:MAG: glycosyltransferase [Alphaproteobacteria bacterium]|nr:glycosyltransferase [Alphaproteobacteria bacterium]
MRILFMHNNFPGQYRRILQYIKDNKTGIDMTAATLVSNEQDFGIKRVNYKPHRKPTEKIHPALFSTEKAVLMGQAAYKALMPLEKKGYKPDIILSHSGWGGNMFLKDQFPDAKLLTYYEWYYHSRFSDGDFLRGEPYDANGQLRIRMKNTPILQDLAAMDWGQSPTQFQHSKLPDIFKDKVSVLHDGVDTDYFAPLAKAKVTIGEHTFSAEDEVITYVARGMEPYRGFPQFIEMVSILQKRRPNLHAVVLGNDRVAYGSERADGKSWKEHALETYQPDMSRLHFLGLQPLKVFRSLMQITSAHVYLTVPFVLSWSMLEAMSTGALIVGSDTDPVKELITDGETGLLVPFHEPEAIADKLDQVLDNKQEYAGIKKAARDHILAKYSVNDLLPQYWQLIESVANGSQK